MGTIFGSPLFGYSVSIEEDGSASDYPKPVRMVTYIAAILGGFGVFTLLGVLLGSGASIPRLSAPDISNRERFFVIALIPAGIAAGIVYTISHAVSSRFSML